MTEKKKKYSLDKKATIFKYSGIASAGIIVGGSLFSFVGCSSRSEQWAETSGQAGRINLEAVEEAMEKSKDVTEFEKRVNEIYQGKELVLIEVKNEDNGKQLVSGYADLNDNNQIDYEEDDLLFTFTRWFEDGSYKGEMRGYGVNSYYHHPYSYGTDMFMTWMLFSALTRPAYMVPVYHTTISDAGAIRSYRDSYRNTPSYRDQVNANRQYESRMSTKHGTAYRNASPNSSRQRWASRTGVNLSKATRISSSAGKSGWGRSGSRGFGGFRGGGSGGGIANV
ncbi:TPA: hypothetical protein ENS27_12870 [bacterium]|nr:hypothetical protein [bacterium]